MPGRLWLAGTKVQFAAGKVPVSHQQPTSDRLPSGRMMRGSREARQAMTEACDRNERGFGVILFDSPCLEAEPPSTDRFPAFFFRARVRMRPPPSLKRGGAPP